MYTVIRGDVLAIFDDNTRPKKIKWHLCVCDNPHYFLRINSNPLFRPNCLLRSAEMAFLRHDSYLEMGRLFEFSPAQVHAAMAAGGYKGRLSALDRRDVVFEIEKATTLTREQKDLIRYHLLREQDVSDEEIWDFRDG